MEIYPQKGEGTKLGKPWGRIPHWGEGVVVGNQWGVWNPLGPQGWGGDGDNLLEWL